MASEPPPIPGVYHPVHAGDVLQNRYHISYKLGMGAFTTVWLAQDTVLNKNVSIKITRENTNEIEIYRHLQRNVHLRKKYPGFQSVLLPIDEFVVDGANGRFVCIVTEVCGPTLSTVIAWGKGKLESAFVKRVGKEMLEAVEYLHAAGVVHGDLHPGNIVFRVPVLDSLSLGQLNDIFGDPDQFIDTIHAPIEFRKDDFEDQLNFGICLIDFGSAFFANRPPLRVETPLHYRSPELIRAQLLTSAMDMWNLGCTTYELVTGCPLFTIDWWESERDLFPRVERVLSKEPEGSRGTLPTFRGVRELHPVGYTMGSLEVLLWQYESRSATEGKSCKQKEVDLLGKYLRKMLVCEAKNRARAADLVKDPWFLS